LVINSGRFSTHTSTRVLDEITRVKNKRLKIYPTIVKFIESGGQLTESSLINYDIHLNENDKSHLESLLQYLALQPNILAFLRAFLRQYSISLEKAIGLVTIFPSVEKPYLRDLITGNGIHKEDAEIIVDAYYWSQNKLDPQYVTIERRAIEENRDTVLHILRGSCTDFPGTSLQLLNIRDLL